MSNCHHMEIWRWYMIYVCWMQYDYCMFGGKFNMATNSDLQWITFTSWQFIENAPFNQLAIYVFLVLLLWCWFITNMAAKKLVEQLYRCLLLAKPKSYFQPLIFFSQGFHIEFDRLARLLVLSVLWLLHVFRDIIRMHIRQTSGESASLPQYLGCNTVLDMRLRVTFLRRKTISLQSNIVHRE